MSRSHLECIVRLLYDLYTETKLPREIWDALKFKNKTEEGTNKFLIVQCFDFKMLDEKPILEQVHELQIIVNIIHSLKIILPESFQLGVIIAKLPPS